MGCSSVTFIGRSTGGQFPSEYEQRALSWLMITKSEINMAVDQEMLADSPAEKGKPKFVGNYKIMELSRDLAYREQKDRCRAWGR